MPRHDAPCAEVTGTNQMLVIDDLRASAAYRDSTLAGTGARFYAGAPLMTRDGYCLGSMCVVGIEPRAISAQERTGLADLAAMVMAQIELQHAIGRIDPVSGIPNRHQFVDDLADLAIDRPGGEARLAALVNLATPGQMSSAVRALGTGVIDDIVCEAARMLRAALGPDAQAVPRGPVPVRLPGRAGRGPGALLRLARRLDRAARRQHQRPLRHHRHRRRGALRHRPGVDPAELLRDMYSAAHDAIDGSHRVRVFSAEQNAAFLRRFRVANDFGAALEDDSQLRLVFQPKIELTTGALRRRRGAPALAPSDAGRDLAGRIHSRDRTDLAGARDHALGAGTRAAPAGDLAACRPGDPAGGQRVGREPARTGFLRPRAGAPARARPGAGRAGHRNHGKRADEQPHAGRRHAGRPGCGRRAAGDRRFRHRLQQPGLSAERAGEGGQDRPELREATSTRTNASARWWRP